MKNKWKTLNYAQGAFMKHVLFIYNLYQPGTASCKECPVGKYSDVDGSNTCKNCTAGTYNDKIGSTSCTSCASGKPPVHRVPQVNLLYILCLR